MNVLAHRPAPVRFDPRIEQLNDWDLVLQLTDDCDPLPLPVVASYYSSDIPGRLSEIFSDEAFLVATTIQIRERALARRGQRDA
jgi:hypothetical protein